MHDGRHIEITIDRAVHEFDFKNAPAFAVANGRNGARFNALTRNVGDDVIRRRVRFRAKCRRGR